MAMPRDKNDARLIRMIQRVVPILMIFSFALFLRLIYLHDYKENPLFSHPQIDAETFVTQAGEMARGTFFSVNPYSFYQPPLYPFLLAIFFKLFTFDLYWLHLLQMILGSCNCVLIYTLGKQCFPAPVALGGIGSWMLLAADLFRWRTAGADVGHFSDLDVLAFFYQVPCAAKSASSRRFRPVVGVRGTNRSQYPDLWLADRPCAYPQAPFKLFQRSSLASHICNAADLWDGFFFADRSGNPVQLES